MRRTSEAEGASQSTSMWGGLTLWHFSPPLLHVLLKSASIMDISDPVPSEAPAPTKKESKASDKSPAATLPIESWKGEDYHLVKEGQAKILYPKGHQVFYNPIQEYNRDMSVMMLRLFAEDWHFKGTSLNAGK